MQTGQTRQLSRQRYKAKKRSAPGARDCEICILAGGTSRRMGRDKARLKLDGRTMLSRIRAMAKNTGLPVRVIRKDWVPRCGPLGGVYTALASTHAAVVLFLSCDMPLVSEQLLQLLLRSEAEAWFVSTAAYGKGFPFLLTRSCLPVVEAQLRSGDFSLQGLAEQLRASTLRPPVSMRGQLFNVNTPQDWAEARRRLSHRNSRKLAASLSRRDCRK